MVTLLALLLAGIIGLFAYLQLHPMTDEETLASRGSPPKPQLTVTSSGPDNVGLTWTPVDLAERYNLQHLDPKTDGVTKVDPLDGAVNIATVAGLNPETDVCFRLSVTRGGLTGPLSDKVCTRTAPPVPTPTPTPSDTPTPTPSPTPSASSASASPPVTPGDPNTDPLMKQAWIAVAGVLPKSANFEAAAQSQVQDLEDNGLVDGRYLDSRFYPRLLISGATPPPTPVAAESFVVYFGPFRTPLDAQNKCVEITNITGQNCFPAQPDPPQ